MQQLLQYCLPGKIDTPDFDPFFSNPQKRQFLKQDRPSSRRTTQMSALPSMLGLFHLLLTMKHSAVHSGPELEARVYVEYHF